MHRRSRKDLSISILEFACLAELFIGLFASAVTGDANINLTSPALQASYNPSFQTPTCLDIGSSCQTDDHMISGVGLFEPNGPNTIDNCTDSSIAIVGQDEYTNRILVRSLDGERMTAGNWLQVHATVRLAADVSGRSNPTAKETIHIYYASDSLGEAMSCSLVMIIFFAAKH